MRTPIHGFLTDYASCDAVRMHMPGHKGRGTCHEKHDLTEVSGADSLFEASGIIAESEKNASDIFGAHTLYSTEGSSLSIRAMLYLTHLYAASEGRRPKIAAARNVHRSFVTAVALLDLEVDWLTSDSDSYLTVRLTGDDVRRYFESTDELPCAVYITSPDYLGFCSDIADIAGACHENGVLLLVDNAHGAYLRFLPNDRHPITLGADMCCDSAHKTLHALTGAGYLHLSHALPEYIHESAKRAMALFASTSPSYLILESLDLLNARLDGKYREDLSAINVHLGALRGALSDAGYTFVGDEPMKLTVHASRYGYSGYEMLEYLEGKGIVCEFADPDYLVLMPSVDTTAQDLGNLTYALLHLPKKPPKLDTPPTITLPKRKMSVREAVLSPSETVPISECLGRTLAAVTVACPPAVPILVSGEVIDEGAIELFRYYGITECTVVK